MLRLTLLLCAGLYGALMVAGADHGQLRPGLAMAEKEALLHPATETVAAVEPAAVIVVAAAETKPAVVPKKPLVEVSYAPEAVVADAAPVLPTPVFSLSALQTTFPEEDAAPVAEVADGGGTIWYVTASSVNVRSGPSTDSEIVGKLTLGEAALLVQQEGEEWARIIVQGDGVEGFVAARFLSPTAP